VGKEEKGGLSVQFVALDGEEVQTPPQGEKKTVEEKPVVGAIGRMNWEKKGLSRVKISDVVEGVGTK